MFFLAALFELAFVVLFWTWPFLLIIWIVMRRRRTKRERKEALTYDPAKNGSSASFASEAEIKLGRGFQKGGLLVGKSLETGQEIFYNPEEGQLKPIIVFGGMGSGKTTSNQIPLALTWGLGGKAK